jgi:large subunit ribosomal protein L18
MADIASQRRNARKRRAKRVRKKVHGTAERPRLAVFRSNRHMFAQIIDDVAGRTLAAAGSLNMDKPSFEGIDGKTAFAKAVGLELARKAQEAGVDTVVFDRAGYLYHGRMAALAEGARDGGLKF